MTDNLDQGTTQCPNCSAVIPAGTAGTCPSCGNLLSAAAPAQPAQPAWGQPPTQSPTWGAPPPPPAGWGQTPGWGAPPPPPAAPQYIQARGAPPAQPPTQTPAWSQPIGQLPVAPPGHRNSTPILLGIGAVVLIAALIGGAFVITQGGKSGASASPDATQPLAVASATATREAATPAATPAPTATAAAKYKGMVVGFVQTGNESGWRSANTESFKDAAVATGVTLKLAYADNDFSKQIDALQGYIADPDVNVIVFAPVQVTGYNAVLKSAQSAGKVVIIEDLNLNVDTSLYYTFVGPDFVLEGQKGAAAMCDLLEGATGAKVIEIAGYATSPAAVDRAKGFRQTMGACGIKIVATKDAQWDGAKAQSMTTAYLKTNKDIQGLVAHNDDMAIGAIKALKAAGLTPGKDVHVVSYDATAAGFAALIAGDIGADVECSPDIAPQVYEAAWNALQGIDSPAKAIPTIETVFFASQGAELNAILATRKY